MLRNESERTWALVLAGGDGKRLQEFTREIAGAPIPKQYCRLLGERSLLEATLARARRFVRPERTAVVVNDNHLDLARAQLTTLPNENVLIQPCNRDTGPGLLFGLLHLAHADPTATVVVFPSDHYVDNDGAFIAHVEQAARVSTLHPDRVVLLGIQPDRPEPGFGYLVPTHPLGLTGAFQVVEFHEKPSRETASALVACKGLWNSFVMVFQLPYMLALLQLLVPWEFDRLCEVQGDSHALAHRYRTLIPWNFSTEVLARIPERLVVVRVDDVHWSDWGTRESVEWTLKTLQLSPPWLATGNAPTMAREAKDLRTAA